MKSKVYISKTEPSDIQSIVHAENVCFSDAWSESSVLSQLCSEYALTLTAKDEYGNFLGYISGGITSPEAEIFRVATLPEYRRMGVGRKLLSRFIKEASIMSCEDFFIEVRESNTPARSLYASFGFSEFSRRKGYYKNPREDAIILSANIKEFAAHITA